MLKTAVLSNVGFAAGTVFFSDTFEDLSKWTPSTWKGDQMGTFESASGKHTKDSSDKQMASQVDAKFYGASASFDSFSNEGKKLIIQYQAKYDKDIECGGGYVKIGPKLEKAENFGDPTEYNIMFGPDKCGYTKRTHLIFSYKGKNHLKTEDLPYKQDKDGVSNLYRLVLNDDNTVEVQIDGEEVYKGNMADDWPLLEPKEISDPDDKKPEDWVDDAMMDDPEDTKPEDWDQPKQIADEKAKKPDDWDTEEDGEWEAPMIDNPKYKGEWSAKRISNPAYKGVWEPKKTANPKYEADDKLYLYKEFGFIGFDLWQVKASSFFDNVIITDDVAEADKFADLWKEQSAYEKEQVESAKKEEADKAVDTAKDDAKDDDDDDVDDDEKDKKEATKDDDEDL